MELSPQAVAAATFKTVKRGYDPDEVRAYLVEVSASLEASHQQATAMEARARAAIAKLQEATQHTPTAAPAPTVPAATADEAETISRTLLLAQRTADATVAEARAEADRILAEARAEAAQLRAAADAEASSATTAAVEQADRLLREATAEAERARAEALAEAERAKSEAHLRAEAEVARLERERQALLTDVDALERHVGDHRERLLAVSAALADLAERGPVGLGPVEPPSLLASVGAATAPADTRPADASPADGSPTNVTPEPASSNGISSFSSLTGGAGGPANGNGVPVGAEPLVSPRPTSIDEVRSSWAQAEEAEAALGGAVADGVDATPTPAHGIPLPPPDPTPIDGTPVPSIDDTGEVDATPPAGSEL